MEIMDGEQSGEFGMQVQMHLKDYIGIVLARRWVFLTAVVVCAVGGYVKLMLTAPRYTSRARLLIQLRPKRQSNDMAEGAEAYAGLSDQMFVNTFMHIMKADPLLRGAYEKFKFHERGIGFGTFKSRLSVSAVPSTQLIDVQLEDEDPNQAAAALGSLIGDFVANNRSRQQGTNEAALKSLREKETYLRTRHAEKTEELYRLMMKNGLDTPGDAESIVVDRLKSLNDSLGELQRKRITTAGVCDDLAKVLGVKFPEVIKWREDTSWNSLALVEKAGAGNGVAVQQIPEYSQNAMIGSLKLQYFQLKQQLNEMTENLGPNHPDVAVQKKKITSVQQQMEIESLGILAVAIAEYRRLGLEEKQLIKELSEQQDRVLAYNKLNTQYRGVLEERNTYAARLQSTQKRLEELRLLSQMGSTYDNVFVIEPPQVPGGPSYPNKMRLMALALFLGLGLGGGLCFFLDYLDTSIKGDADATAALQLPLLGHVPAVSPARRADGSVIPAALVAISKPKSHLAEAFRAVRTAISFSSTTGEMRHIQVTSALPTEGKSLVSINLAVTMAQAGKKVLLVDADMRKPSLAKVIQDLDTSYGLPDALIGKPLPALPDGYQQVPGVAGLHILPCSVLPPNPAELLTGPRLPELLAEWDSYFDLIVFDTPPVIMVTDSAALGSRMDGTVLVVRSFSTQRSLAVRARDLLLQAQVPLLGIVLNGVNTPRGYGYGRYGYGYGYGYGGYGDGAADNDYYEESPEGGGQRSEVGDRKAEV